MNTYIYNTHISLVPQIYRIGALPSCLNGYLMYPYWCEVCPILWVRHLILLCTAPSPYSYAICGVTLLLGLLSICEVLTLQINPFSLCLFQFGSVKGLVHMPYCWWLENTVCSILEALRTLSQKANYCFASCIWDFSPKNWSSSSAWCTKVVPPFLFQF